jgi:exodeoxyribonuclease V alpha subunit
MENEPSGGEVIEGTVERVVFRNPQNGYTVVRLAVDGSPLLDTVVGSYQELSVGERVRFTGLWTVDKRHGRQFKAETCLPITPSTVIGIEKFLGSGLIHGVGPVMAGRVVERFGAESLDVIEKEPQRLATVPGIGPVRARSIQKAMVEKRAVKEVMVFLESAGVSPTFAHRVYQRYGADAIRVVSENPYRLAADVRGIGFSSADRIAAHLGVEPDSPHRAEAGLIHVLDEMSSEGHVYATAAQLMPRAAELLGIEIVDLESALDRLVLMGGLRREGRGEEARVYLPGLHAAERSAARSLSRLLVTPARKLPVDAAGAIRRAERLSGIELAAEQRRAFHALGRAKVMVLTGGPGTGKTTLLEGLAASLADLDLSVALAAPTGRAARRMSESTGRDARTIHRLLEFTPRTGSFERGLRRPLDEDVVIIDEVSMVDIDLLSALLEALRPEARLILVGDPNQLPSVGPGAVLADLIALEREAGDRLAVVRLNEIFRQARASLIVTGAHEILSGREPRTGDRGERADLFMIERDEPAECLEVIRHLVSSRIPARFRFDPIVDVQVLTPMHKGLLGAASLNAELRDLLNPSGQEVGRGETRFRVGDKVMQVRNNYDLEVFNGDVGRITAAGESEPGGWVEVLFPERTVRYPAAELGQIALSYACSIHKSQGSEYPAVVIPLHTQHFVMLQRTLLYTAVTRGRRLVVIVGSRRALRIAVGSDSRARRNSALTERAAAELSRPAPCDPG